MMGYHDIINFSSISSEAFKMIHELDKSWIGSDNYIGLAYFWNYEYRHFLRDTTTSKRRRIHNKLLQTGLDVSGASDDHLSIIRSVVKQ